MNQSSGVEHAAMICMHFYENSCVVRLLLLAVDTFIVGTEDRISCLVMPCLSGRVILM